MIVMSFINEPLNHPGPVLSPVKPQKPSGKEFTAATVSENEKLAEQRSDNASGDSDPDVVLVDFEENDPKNPLNWSRTHKWLIVFSVSWMGFVR